MNPTDPRITAALMPGERLLWSGVPDPKVNFTGMDLLLIPFSILWFSFALFFIGSALTKGFPSPIPYVMAAFFGIAGLYFVLGRFFVKRTRKLSSAYAITSERAIAFMGKTQRAEASIRSTPLAESTSRDGRHASVTFGTPDRRNGMLANTGWDVQQDFSAVRFFDVEDPQPMLAAIRTARAPRAQNARE